MRNSTALFAILIATVPAPSFAANWVHQGRATSGATLFIDTTSFLRSGGVVKVWVKSDNSTATSPSPTDPAKILNHMEFKCSSRETRTTYEIMYNAKGDVIFFDFANATFESMIPDSICEGLGLALCVTPAR